MGAAVSAVAAPFVEQQKIAKVMEMRQNKAMRDTQIAMQVALAKDRVYWMLGAIGTLGTIGALRTVANKTPRVPVPAIPGVIVTTVVLYHVDLVWGSKLNRINEDVQRIKEDKRFWFNDKMKLPPAMRKPYRQAMDQLNQDLAASGEPPAPEWAE